MRAETWTQPWWALGAPSDPKVWTRRLRIEDRRLPLPRQILEGGGVKQRLVKLSALKVAQL